jgi:hypothetical protein
MGISDKIILLSMVARGVTAFGLTFYSLANFARWYIEESNREKEE